MSYYKIQVFPQTCSRTSTNLQINSTIFKTFDSDINKWTSKIGIFGRSFNDIGKVIYDRYVEIQKLTKETGNLAEASLQVDSVWKRLYGNKNDFDWIKNSSGEIITSSNIDSFMPKLDDVSAGSLLTRLQKEQGYVDANKKSWQGYFSTLKDSEKWQIEFVQNTDLQKASLDDVKIAQEKGREATIQHNVALKQQTLGAKAASVAMKGLALAGNIALSMLASWAVGEIIKGIDNFIHKSEKLKETLEESVSAFDKTTDEVKDLEEQIDECTTKIEELQKLADDGTISIMDEEQLRLLKDENAELEKNLALKKDKQIRDAQDVLVGAENNANQKVRSQYEYDYSYDNFGEAFGDGFKLWIVGTPIAEQITPEEELANAVNSYKNHYENYGWVDEAASDRAAEMYALISPSIEAYEKLIATGYELNDTEETRYNQLKQAQSAYLEHLYLVRGTATEFKALNAEQQRNVLLNRLIKQGLSEDVAKAIISSISDEDLDKYWNKDFSFVPPEMKDGETAEEYGKRFAEAWAKGLEDGAKNLDETVISLDKLKNASEGISSLQKAFKELSDDGYITIDTLSEIKKAVGGSVSNWDEYEAKLRNAKVGSSEFKQTMSDLTYAILENKLGAAALTEVNEDKIASILRENGVLESNVTAHKMVQTAKASNIAESYRLGTKTYEEAEALIKEGFGADVAGAALYQLQIAKILLNDTEVNTVSDVQQILNIGNAALMSSTSIRDMRRALVELSEDFMGPLSQTTIDIQNGTYVPMYDPLDISTVRYSSPGGGDSGSSSKNEPDYKDPTDAIINRINLQSKQLEKDAEVIQDNIDLAESEKDYNEQLELTNDLISNQTQRVKALKVANENLSAEADKLRDANPQYDTTTWFDPYGELTEEYYDVYNNLGTKEEQEKVEELAQSLQKLKQAWYDNAEEIADVNKELLDNKESIEDIRTDIYDKQISDIEHARDMLLNNDPDADVTSFYKQLQEAYHARVDYLRSVDPVKYADEIKELQILWWDAQKELDDIALGKYEELREAEIKHLEVKYDKEQAIISALEKRYDVQRQIRDKQAEIDAELAASKALPEYLEDNSTLFNDKDYKKLSSELSGIDKEIVGLYNDYRREINNLAEDEWYKQEEITAQFERQLDVAMDKYELAEKELELTKKRLEYDNIIKQRDTRIMVAGHWINTADPDKVREAQKAYAQVQSEKENLVLTQAEDAALRSMQSVSDSTNTLKLSIENIATMLDNLSEGELARFARTLDVETLDEWLSEVSLADYSAFGSNCSSSTRLVPSSAPRTSNMPTSWFNPENKAVRYTGIDENGNLISEPLPEGYSGVFEVPQSVLEKALSSSTDFVQRIMQTVPNYTAMMPSFTTPSIPNIQTNNMSNVTQYTFTGDISIDNPIGDPNDLVHALASQTGQVFNVTKNMK